MRRLDWERFASEMQKHLDRLKPNERPMPVTNWPIIFGLSDDGFLAGIRKHIPAMAQVYRARRQAWWDKLVSEVTRNDSGPAKQLDRVALARKYHVTHEQMCDLIDNIRARSRRRLAYEQSKKANIAHALETP